MELQCPFCGETVAKGHPIYDVKDISETSKGIDIKVLHLEKTNRKYLAFYRCEKVNMLFAEYVLVSNGSKGITYNSSLPPFPHTVSLPVTREDVAEALPDRPE